jgi:hypothetical protein
MKVKLKNILIDGRAAEVEADEKMLDLAKGARESGARMRKGLEAECPCSVCRRERDWKKIN